MTEDIEEFEYVVERKKPAKICFGSTLPRDTDLLSPFQSRFKYEYNPQVTPMTYNLERTTNMYMLNHKVRSNRGVVGLANKAPRFPKTKLARIPSPTRYNPKLDYNESQPSTVPFRSMLERRTFTISNTPGPGEYSSALPRCHRTLFQCNFGRPRMESAVQVQCQPELLDGCSKCLQICDGDYWTFNYEIYLCHSCMVSERCLHEIFPEMKLKMFKKIRACSFKHRHEQTTASIKLLTRDQIVQRERLENYLSLFIPE